MGLSLAGLAKFALPILGGAAGSFIPGVGTALGASLGAGASGMIQKGQDRKAANKEAAGRSLLYKRNLQLAEQDYANKEPLRQQGTAALSQYFGGEHRGIFR